MTDDELQELIPKARAGDVAARNTLLAECVKALEPLAKKLTGAHYDQSGVDLLQKTAERGLEKFPSWEEPTVAQLRAWLSIIMRHLHLEKIRREKVRRADPMPEDKSASGVSVGTAAAAREEKELFRAALKKLPERDRQLILWRLDGKGFAEIAQLLDLGYAERARQAHQAALRRLQALLRGRP